MKSKYYSVPVVAALALLINTVSVFAVTTDDTIEATARESYIFKNYLKDDNIKVSSQEGIVTLTGSVSEEIHKALAQETVESLAGVKGIDNRLEIKATATSTNDALINARVKLELRSHSNLSAANTEVDVQGGVVTLTGQAKNQAQIDLTTEYIKDVDGVVEVQNKVSVANDGTTPKTMGEKAEHIGKRVGAKVENVENKISTKAEDLGEKIDDASITALVKATLLFHRSTSAIKTRVETRDGHVTLTGIARNASEKELAGKYVKDVSGVKSVVNNMSIEGVRST